MALKFLDTERQDDFELCVKAVQQDGFALQCRGEILYGIGLGRWDRFKNRGKDARGSKFATYIHLIHLNSTYDIRHTSFY